MYGVVGGWVRGTIRKRLARRRRDGGREEGSDADDKRERLISSASDARAAK